MFRTSSYPGEEMHIEDRMGTLEGHILDGERDKCIEDGVKVCLVRCVNFDRSRELKSLLADGKVRVMNGMDYRSWGKQR